MATATTSPTVPVYEHDCSAEDGCTYLGSMPVSGKNKSFAAAGVTVVDLWVHTYADNPSYGRSLIYRYSDYRPDYLSIPYDLLDEEGKARTHANPFYAAILARA